MLVEEVVQGVQNHSKGRDQEGSKTVFSRFHLFAGLPGTSPLLSFRDKAPLMYGVRRPSSRDAGAAR